MSEPSLEQRQVRSRRRGAPRLARTVERGLIYLAAVVVAVAVLAPFLWLVISSVASGADLLARPLRWLPSQASLDRYVKIFTSLQPGESAYTFRQALINSLEVSAGSVGISMAVGIFAAYAFARLRFPGRNGLALLFLTTYMLPPIALVIPLYLILGHMHLRDTISGLVLIYCSFITPYVIWIMKGYFEAIPVELEEAAMVDGSSRLGSLFRVILPLSAPGLVTTFIFSLLLAWDEFLYALIMTSSVQAKTIPVAIAEFSGAHMIDYGMMAAGGVLAALPPVVLALVLQRQIISGLTAGAVKG
ncbi:MAG: carbohydrate ABC transporter permease [Firmicutes bacterium]|nr:carbohydrate ABC transporter permease [Bacillota bacterium]